MALLDFEFINFTVGEVTIFLCLSEKEEFFSSELTPQVVYLDDATKKKKKKKKRKDLIIHI